MKERKKKQNRLRDILNPANLQKKIDSYGYDFTMGKYLVTVLLSVVAAIVFGLLYSLEWKFIAIIAIAIILMLPNIIMSGYKNMYEHKRFLDLSDYMEQLLYSFKVNKKIVSTLRDTQTLFTGKMYNAIQEAIDYIESGKTQTGEENLYQKALKKIEEQYPNDNLKAIHSYLQVVEKNGGETDVAVDLLLMNKNIWADNILILQEEKKKTRTTVFGAIFLTMGIAAVFHWMYHSMPQFNVVSNPVVQAVTTIYILLNIWIWQKTNKELAKSWIERERDKKSERAVTYMKMIKEWDEKKERKKSLLMAAPFFVAVIPFLIFGRNYLALAALVAGVFLINQHKYGYRAAYNTVVQEINMTFPRWLMELALLLQGNNVQNAIARSEESAPEILKEEIKELVLQMREEPGAQEPYINFLKEFQLSTVQSAMKMLYAITEKGSGEVQTQVNALIERNSKLLDKAEKMENDRKLAGMKGLFMAPQLTVAFQMIVTMGVFMISFLQYMNV